MLNRINKELLERAMGANTKEDALEILKQGGVELTEEDLQSISGGEGEVAPCSNCYYNCPTYGF